MLGFAARPPRARMGGGDAGPSSSWLITRQDDGSPAPVTGVLSFSGGNVIIEHDINPAGPPFTGTWASRGQKRFAATFWSGQAGSGPNQPCRRCGSGCRDRSHEAT